MHCILEPSCILPTGNCQARGGGPTIPGTSDLAKWGQDGQDLCVVPQSAGHVVYESQAQWIPVWGQLYRSLIGLFMFLVGALSVHKWVCLRVVGSLYVCVQSDHLQRLLHC